MRSKALVLSLGGHEHRVVRARLGKYLLLEQIRKQPLTAETLRSYLEVALGCAPEGSGLELVKAYVALVSLNRITVQIPFLTRSSGISVEIPWDYEDRWMISWVHTLAYAYHWSRRAIRNLDIDEAVQYLQEINVETQMDREWTYSMSQNCFDAQGKFKALVRPAWMRKSKAPQPPIPEFLKPVGLILDARSFRLH